MSGEKQESGLGSEWHAFVFLELSVWSYVIITVGCCFFQQTHCHVKQCVMENTYYASITILRFSFFGVAEGGNLSHAAYRELQAWTNNLKKYVYVR